MSRVAPARRMAFLVALAASGCGGQELFPAGGTVAYPDGTPVTSGMVMFEPTAEGAKSAARGDVRPDGTFRLGTNAVGDGAAEGEYKVLVMPARIPEGYTGPVPPGVHPKYTDFATSGLRFTVTRDAARNDFRVTVEKPGRR